MDNRKNNGGARAGAGRPKKEDELNLRLCSEILDFSKIIQVKFLN